MSKQTSRDPYRGRDPREIPAYTVSQSAHYLRVAENTIRNWAFGRAYPTRSGQMRWTKPLIDAADEPNNLFSFVNLLELHVLSALRQEHSVEMKKIRRAVEWLGEHLNSPHPLIDKGLQTDGTDVFIEEYGRLINASVNGQIAMKALLKAHLKRIERDSKGSPIRLFPFTWTVRDASAAERVPRLIAIDPLIAFGRPVIAGSRVPSAEIFERFRAGETIEAIADDFRRTTAEVAEAIRCEAAA